MKNKVAYFTMCFLIYIGIYFVEEVFLTFLIALFGVSSIVGVYAILALCFTVNLWLTWKIANYIDRKYLSQYWLENKKD